MLLNNNRLSIRRYNFNHKLEDFLKKSQLCTLAERTRKVKATVKTNNAIIAGSYNGEMIASGEVEITATGKFIGNLTQKDALLTIQKGGLFKGQSIISDNQDIFKIEIPEKPKISSAQKPTFAETRTRLEPRPFSEIRSPGAPVPSTSDSQRTVIMRNPIPPKVEQNIKI
jgi:hypothetical protein